MAIRTLLMDIGGVLLFPDQAFWRRLIRDFGAPADVEQIFYSANGPWDLCKVGAMTYEQYLTRMAEQLGVERKILADVRSHHEWVVNQPMADWLWEKKQQGLEIIAVSNADTTLEERLEQGHLVALFDHIVNSARVHVAKPDPAIYGLALNLTRSRPEQCLFVDDRERNMPPAQALGIRTLQYIDMPAFLRDVKSILDMQVF